MPRYGYRTKRRFKRKVGRPSRRRKLQTMNKMTRRAVNLVTGAAPLANAAYNLYRNYRKGRRIPYKAKAPKSQGTGGYNQWSQDYKSGYFGKLTMKKIDRLSTDKIIYTHRLIGPFNDNGRHYLSNFQDSIGRLFMPMVLIELNSANQIINNVVTNANPVHQLFQDGTTIKWNPLNGQNPSGVALSPAWQLENSSHLANTAGSVPLEAAIHKWSSLDLELWGCKNKPTKYHIALVQFSEDVLPDWNDRTAQSAEFWQSMMKHFIYSPLAKMDDGYNRKKFKILKQYTYNIDPTSSYENDADPHVKTLKLFYRFNRHTNFAWQWSNPNVLSVGDMDDADYRQEAQQPSTQCHPNARIYVMVRASNYTKVIAPATIENTTNPSISWRLRTCYMVNN